MERAAPGVGERSSEDPRSPLAVQNVDTLRAKFGHHGGPFRVILRGVISVALPVPASHPGRPVRLLGLALRTGLVASAALLVVNALPFFGADVEATPFFADKGELSARLAWRIPFFVHVASAVLCLVTGVALLSKRLLVRAPAVHRALGWTYAAVTIGFVVPSGLLLAPTAGGGLAGRSGFVAIGLVLLGTTGMGLRYVFRRDFVSHRAWMLRSFAATATALSFRCLYAPLALLGAPNAYGISVWASLAVNVVLSEHRIESLARRSPA